MSTHQTKNLAEDHHASNRREERKHGTHQFHLVVVAIKPSFKSASFTHSFSIILYLSTQINPCLHSFSQFLKIVVTCCDTMTYGPAPPRFFGQKKPPREFPVVCKNGWAGFTILPAWWRYSKLGDVHQSLSLSSAIWPLVKTRVPYTALSPCYSVTILVGCYPTCLSR